MNKQYTDIISVNFESSVTSSFLALTIKTDKPIINYQVEMITKNNIKSVLPISIRRSDDKININYDITSKIPLSQYLKRKSLSKSEFLELLCSITGTLIGSRKYLLGYNNFLIDENYIYIQPGTMEISMAYLPLNTNTDVENILRELILKLIIDTVNLDEQGGDNYIQRILNCLRGECFKLIELDKLMQKLKGTEPAVDQDVSLGKGIADNDNIIKDNVSKLIDKIDTRPAKQQISENSTMESVSKPVRRYKKNTIITAVLFQVLLISLGLLIYQMTSSGAEASDAVSIFSGLVLILGAINFLVLRKLLDKANMEEVFDSKSSAINEFYTKHEKIGNNEINIPDYNKNEVFGGVNNRNIEKMPSNNLETIAIIEEEPECFPYFKRVEEGSEERISITKSSFIIGRLKGQVDHELENKAIGRMHVEVITKEDRCFIKDLNSRNGTKINNNRIFGDREHEIMDGDIITFADIEFEFFTK